MIMLQNYLDLVRRRIGEMFHAAIFADSPVELLNAFPALSAN